MLYALSLRPAGIIVGVLLIALAAFGFLERANGRDAVNSFPRTRIAGVVLLTIDLVWVMWLLATMEMGEFSVFRTPLLVATPIAYLLTLRFVNEFLAVRALGILLLLGAEPLLEAAFLRYESGRLLVTTFAYIIIVLGLLWVTMPYTMRDQLRWLTRSSARWTSLQILLLACG